MDCEGGVSLVQRVKNGCNSRVYVARSGDIFVNILGRARLGSAGLG